MIASQSNKEATTMKCPRCGAEMREKDGRYGRFLGCSDWPRCDGSRGLSPTDNTEPREPGRRKAGLRVLWAEVTRDALRPSEPRPYPLSIYRPDEEESVSDRSCRSR